MNRDLRTAGLATAVLMGCLATPALADDAPPAADWFGQAFANAAADPLFDTGLSVGPWTIGPVAEIQLSSGGPSGAGYAFGQRADSRAARLGFRGAAKVDSRVGAIYSRLSLSFKHEFRANDHQVVSGYPGARRTGFYGDRAEVDVMTADAMFAMPLSAATYGFLEYGAEMEPGNSADHQVTLRLRFDF